MKMLDQIRYIFTRNQKIKFVLLFFVLLIGAGLEMAGVALIFPFIEVVTNPGIIFESKTYSLLYGLIHAESTNEFLVWMSVALIVMFFVKNAYLILANYIQLRFVTNCKLDLSERLMECYMKKPYPFHLQKNSAELIRTVTSDVGNLFNLVTSCMNMLSEVLVSIMLCIFLIIKDPMITLMVLVLLGGFSLFYYQVIKKKIKQFGIYNQVYNAKMIMSINQAFGGIKEVKILHREQHFIDEFVDNGRSQMIYSKRNAMLTMLPRYILEVLSMGGVLAMIAVKLSDGVTTGEIITQLSVFAMAAYRLLPAVNRMNTYVSTITYLTPSIDLIYKDMKDTEDMSEVLEAWKGERFDKTVLSRSNQPEAINIKNVTFHYPDAEPEDTVIRNASFQIPTGKSTAFIGPSGAGKTTMADIILGVLEPTAGEVVYGDMNVHHHKEEWSKKLGYIPQVIYLADDTIRSNVAFGVSKSEIDDGRVWAALEKAQIKTFVEELESGLDSMIGERGARISGGQRQRLGIARALYHNPDILVLDEATSALDNDTETAVMEAIDNLSGEKTLLIIAHRLSTIRNCQLVYKIENNQVLQVENTQS